MAVPVNTPRYPPLWTWGAALILAALILAGLAAWNVRARDAYLTEHFGLARLDVDARDVPVIVALGSSKTRCALEFDQDMDQVLQQHGVKAHFIRITRGSVTAEDLRLAFARIVELRPALVLVEADLLLYEPNVYRRLDTPVRDGWRQRLRSGAGSVLIGDSAFDEQTPDVEFENTPRSRLTGCGAGTQEPLASHLRTLATRRGSDPAELAAYMAAFEIFRSRGINVQMIEYPHAPDAEAGFPRHLRSAAALTRTAIIRTGLASEFWKETPMLSQQEFLDAGHMNSSGRASMSQLFAARMAELRPR